MIERYFAYGSNMKSARLRSRAPSARALGAALLRDHRLRVRKRGADGTGKANLVPGRGDAVWGVLYEIAVAEWSRLDRHEGGYVRRRVEVETREGARLAAVTYVSDRTVDAPPFDWYRALLVEGAREHGLPEGWIARLEALPRRQTSPTEHARRRI